MIKLQREKKLSLREQFELQHDDASINGDASYFNFDRKGNDSELANYEMLKNKNRSKFGGKYIFLLKDYKRKTNSTFGTVQRFAPEPGSVHSYSQQKVLNSFKKA